MNECKKNEMRMKIRMSEDRVYTQPVEPRGVSRGTMTEGDSYDGKTKGSQWGAVEDQYK